MSVRSGLQGAKRRFEFHLTEYEVCVSFEQEHQQIVRKLGMLVLKLAQDRMAKNCQQSGVGGSLLALDACV